MPAIAGKHALQGADRVAAILLTMGKAGASRLMKHFDPDEIKLITRSVADLPPVPALQLRSLVEDFATQFAAGLQIFPIVNQRRRRRLRARPQPGLTIVFSGFIRCSVALLAWHVPWNQ